MQARKTKKTAEEIKAEKNSSKTIEEVGDIFIQTEPKDGDHDVYIPVAKPQKTVFLDRVDKKELDERRVRMYKEQQAKIKISEEEFQRRKQMKIQERKRKEEEEANKKTPEMIKRERIMPMIQAALTKYIEKDNYKRKSGSEGFRSEKRGKLFEILLYCVEELREMDSEALNQQQKKIVSLSPVRVFEYAKDLVEKIDKQMCNSMIPESYKFRDHWFELLRGMEADENLKLRRKVLTEEMTPNFIATCCYTEFYSDSFREEKRKQQESQLRAMFAGCEPSVPPPPQEEEYEITYGNTPVFKSHSPKQKKIEHYNHTTLITLKNVVGEDLPNRMYKFLDEEVAKKADKKELMESLEKNFGKRSS